VWPSAVEATHTWQELSRPTDDPEPTALACYGLRRRPRPPQADQMGLRCVTGRPGRAVTMALLLIWDKASWHRSHAVRPWLRQHQQQGKGGAEGGRIVVCPWPSKSPWLNPIEPQWGHGKRAVSEADRLWSADALEARV